MTTLLERIDAAVVRGETRLAAALLRQLFEEKPTLGNAAVVEDRFSRLGSAAPTTRLKVAVLRSYTLEPMVPLLRAAALCHGLALDVKVGAFNAYVQEIVDPASWLPGFAPDVVMLAIQTRDLLPAVWTNYADLPEGAADCAVDEVADDLRAWVGQLRASTGANVVVFNFEAPPVASLGLADAQGHGQMAAIARLNAAVRALADQPGVTVLDYDALVARHGRARFHDERRFLTTRLPIAADCLIHLANDCLRTLLAITGQGRKCLVVDLDNTLWGGVVGEDGPTGVRLGGEYPGAAHVALQRALLDLSRRGVLLAISSKNNLPDAMDVLDKHPGMLLRPSDFSAIRINWNPKSQSLREIAAELNIGLDSLAFLDDNPVEREQVRTDAPEVYVIEVPAEPMAFADTVRACPVFERRTLTAEDRERGRQYAAQSQRAELGRGAGSLEDFYRSLDMELVAAPVGPATLPRAAQLTQKTNQFNLTTRRYTEAELASRVADPSWRAFTFGVKDRFGDNGIVGVAMLRAGEAGAWHLDNFLMSCRVIGRTVEAGMLALVADATREQGGRTLRGVYVPTAKNGLAGGFFEANGFRLVDQHAEGAEWELDLAAAREVPPWLSARWQRGDTT
ncbi:MAG: HAD-IIIC family phosphatase [Acidobacteriota bacterium]